MHQPSPAHRRLLKLLWIIGAAGFVGLLVWAAHAGQQANLLHFFAIVWFLVFGAARILVRLDEALADPSEAATDRWSRLRGRGEL